MHKKCIHRVKRNENQKITMLLIVEYLHEIKSSNTHLSCIKKMSIYKTRRNIEIKKKRILVKTYLSHNFIIIVLLH